MITLNIVILFLFFSYRNSKLYSSVSFSLLSSSLRFVKVLNRGENKASVRVACVGGLNAAERNSVYNYITFNQNNMYNFYHMYNLSM